MNKWLIGLCLIALSFQALAQRAISVVDGEIPISGNIAIPVSETAEGAESYGELATIINQRTDGNLFAALNEAGFSGKADETLSLYGIKPYGRIDLIGVGQGAVDRVGAEDFGGTAATLNNGSNGKTLQVLWSGVERDADATAARVAFGFVLGDYRFDRYQASRLDPDTLGDVMVITDMNSAIKEFDDDLRHLADAIYLARNMASEPANVIYPETFVERVTKQFEGLRNIDITVLEVDDMEKLGMGAHLGVGKGSQRPPRLLIIEYSGGGDEAPLLLAGKGITFDTGGISLKDKDNMWFMKADMTGAAVVSATVLAAARRNAPINLVVLAAMAENMPSGSATRPGDVLTSMSGKTIEIKSTDAEGRLVLADAVHYGQEMYQPDVLIDVATLTGSVGRAVGEFYAGLFSNNEDLASQLLEAGNTAGETLWQLPLDERYYEQNSSEIADVRNGGSGRAGASNGAAFIGAFIQEDQVWAHLDIAGVDNLSSPWPTVPAGYSAWGVRLLDEYIRQNRE